MTKILESLAKSVKYLFHPKVIVVLFIPSFAAFLLWLVAGFFTWPHLIALFSFWLQKIIFFQWFQQALSGWLDLATVLALMASLLAILLFLPIIYFSSLFLVSIFITPMFIRWLIPEAYPQVKRIEMISSFEAMKHSIKYILIFIFWLFLSLPLWLLPAMALVIPVILGAWLNKKVFLFECLQSHASMSEIKQLEKNKTKELWVLGALLMLLNYVPFGFFFTPVLSSLAYLFYSFSALQVLRQSQLGVSK